MLLFIHTTSMIFFAAAIQGFFLAVVVGLHRRNAQANQILALLIGLLSLDLLQQIYYAEAFYRTHPALISFTNVFPLSYGGLLYLYVRSFMRVKAVNYRDFIHFLVLIVGILVSLPYWLKSGDLRLDLLESFITNGLPWQLRIFTLLMPLVATVYGLWSFMLLQRLPYRHDPRLHWLRVMLTLNMLIWVVVWLSILPLSYFDFVDEAVIYLLVSLVIYLLGYFSLRQPDIFIPAPSTQLASPSPATPKYGDNRLNDELREGIWRALESFMQQGPLWRSSNLTLTQLAESTGIAVHHISQVLNDHKNLSFSDYLNQYRVRAVCQLLDDGSDQALLDIALACGFSSKSSFNAIFKKHTGKTPSEYRKNLQS